MKPGNVYWLDFDGDPGNSALLNQRWRAAIPVSGWFLIVAVTHDIGYRERLTFLYHGRVYSELFVNLVDFLSEEPQ